MMNKEQKKNYIEEMIGKFENSKAVMVTHYQGLNMIPCSLILALNSSN